MAASEAAEAKRLKDQSILETAARDLEDCVLQLVVIGVNG